MKFILQQVTQASITINTNTKKSIWPGLVVYVGIMREDSEEYAHKIEKFISTLKKMKKLSLNSDKIDQTLNEVWGSILLVSNFTLWGRMKKWTKVDFGQSAAFDEAERIYNSLILELQKHNFTLETGEFGAMMDITSTVHGPINYILEY